MAGASGHNIYPAIAISVTAISLFYCLPYVRAVSSAVQSTGVHILWNMDSLD